MILKRMKKERKKEKKETDNKAAPFRALQSL